MDGDHIKPKLGAARAVAELEVEYILPCASGGRSLVPLCLGRIGWRAIALGGQNQIAV